MCQPVQLNYFSFILLWSESALEMQTSNTSMWSIHVQEGTWLDLWITVNDSILLVCCFDSPSIHLLCKEFSLAWLSLDILYFTCFTLLCQLFRIGLGEWPTIGYFFFVMYQRYHWNTSPTLVTVRVTAMKWLWPLLQSSQLNCCVWDLDVIGNSEALVLCIILTACENRLSDFRKGRKKMRPIFWSENDACVKWLCIS